jgi:hypothetical protein
MNESLKTRITSNTILARELRRKLSLRFGEGTRAANSHTAQISHCTASLAGCTLYAILHRWI